MKNNQSKRISTFGSRVSSIISVGLVLLLLGLTAMALITGRNITDDVRRNIGFILKMDRDIPETTLNKAKQILSGAKYVETFVFSSSEDILASESALLGEDISELVEINPYASEFDVRLRPSYANPDSLQWILYDVRTIPGVSEVITESDVIETIDTNLRRVTSILLFIALALMLISFVLINNTVSLSIHSRRFLIHTMRLVGATGGFIRRPFVAAGCLYGLIAGVCASLVLAGLRWWASQIEPVAVESALPWWPAMTLILAGVMVLGVLLCLLASYAACSRQLRTSYDEMFHQ